MNGVYSGGTAYPVAGASRLNLMGALLLGITGVVVANTIIWIVITRWTLFPEVIDHFVAQQLAGGFMILFALDFAVMVFLGVYTKARS